MATIIIKNSSTAGNTPSILESGELALNVTDGRLFYGSSSVVKEFTGGGGGSSSFATTASYALTASYVIGGSSTINTGSFATTGSNIFIGNQTITGSINLTGSLNQVGNYNHTGSVYHSGSKFLTGIFSQTGSLVITGSTTQIGSNNLFGNTSLSGSITISGSLGQGTPTVGIYGDTNLTGYLRMLPVVTNIDTSISASYIYVSGSTQDLYFSQNGKGYNNVTRLRWLEGNLYTGIFNGGLITTQSSTVFQVGSGSGVIVNLNASFNDNPYPTVQYLNWGNLSASIATLSASYDQSFAAVNSSGSITVQGTPYLDGDYNTKIPIGVVVHQNRSTINAVQTFPSVAYGWKQRSFDFIKAFGPLKISGYTLTPSGSSTGSLVLSGGVSWVDGRNYIVDPSNPSYITEANGITVSKIYRYRQSGSGWAYDTNGGAGYAAIDPSQYSNNGVLTPVATNDWSIQRVFYFPNSATKAFYIYYGNATYPNEAAALAAVTTETFSEAPNTAANAIYVGFMLLRHNADFTNDASYTIQAASLFRAAGSGGGGGGGSTTPGGNNTEIQYNNNGAFGGVTNLTWNGTTLSATGSLLGTASFAQTASYFSGVFGNNFTASFTNESTWTVNHNLGNRNVLIQAYDGNYQQIIPQTITQTNANTATITFPTNESGFAVVSLGGSYNVSTASFSNQALTASFVNTLNQNVIITGSLTIGSGSTGATENTLTLGPPIAGGAGEGGQLGLNAAGGSYTSASFLDTWQNTFRILKGTNNSSTGEMLSINLQTGNVNIPGGSVMMPSRPAFRVTGSSVTGIAATTTITSTQGAVVEYNQGNYYNNTTGIFTAPIAGLYHVYLNLRTQTAGSQQAIIIKNSTNMIMWETNANTGHFGVSGILSLAVNDTLKVNVTVGTVQFDGNDSWGAAYIG